MAVKDALAELGFTVRMGINRDKNEMVKLLDETLADWRGHASEIVVYYSGHGLSMGKNSGS